MKKKLALIVVCFALLVGILVRNALGKADSAAQMGAEHLSDGKSPTITKTVSKSGGILRAEAFRLISYLYYKDQEIQAVCDDTKFEDVGDRDWYEPYVAAVYAAGFTNQADVKDTKNYMRPQDSLTVGECVLLMERISATKDLKVVDIYHKAGITLTDLKSDENVKIEDFLTLYEAVVELIDSKKEDAVSQSDSEVQVDQLYVLEAGQGKQWMTQKGSYDISAMQYYEAGEDSKEESKLTGKGNPQDYMNRSVEVCVAGDKILYLRGIIDEPVTLENVYIVQASEQEIKVFLENVTKTYELQAPLNTSIKNTIGNITVDQGQVTAVSIKPDTVTGKVLAAKKNYIELDHYGKVDLEEGFRIYKVYGDLAMEEANSILVGYSNTQFVLSDNKICAALITEPISVSNIRVLIKSNGYKSNYHDQVTLTSNEAFTLQYGSQTKKFKAGEKVKLSPGSEYLKKGRVKIACKSEKGKLKISSLERSGGNPSYRGTIEVTEDPKGLLVVNELSIEEYLYGVVPSEMPTSYGLEALKVQAVCARSYAYRQLMANSCSAFGAHVDDSVSYQVYNNVPENKDSIKAVKETYGQVLEYNGDIITAYYFSTSCGYTSSMQDVWTSGKGTDYLVGSLQMVPKAEEADDSRAVAAMSKEASKLNLSDENAFRDFLTKNSYDTLDSEFPWYRWKVEFTYKQLTKIVNERLADRYQANPSLILTQRNGDNGITYESQPITNLGEVTGLEVIERKRSGIVTALLIKGSKATVLVKTEYNIRALLAPTRNVVIRQDNSTIKDLSLLPSAFFILDESANEDSKAGVTITGGGYGHGVGMSQNGVKAMVDLGYDYESILQHYYQKTELTTIYGTKPEKEK